MSKSRPPTLRGFLSSSAIKVVLPKYVVLIMRIIYIIRDDFKHGGH